MDVDQASIEPNNNDAENVRKAPYQARTTTNTSTRKDLAELNGPGGQNSALRVEPWHLRARLGSVETQNDTFADEGRGREIGVGSGRSAGQRA